MEQTQGTTYLLLIDWAAFSPSSKVSLSLFITLIFNSSSVSESLECNNKFVNLKGNLKSTGPASF